MDWFLCDSTHLLPEKVKVCGSEMPSRTQNLSELCQTSKRELFADTLYIRASEENPGWK